MGAGVLVGSKWDADGDEQDVGYRQVHDEKVGSIPHLAVRSQVWSITRSFSVIALYNQ